MQQKKFRAAAYHMEADERYIGIAGRKVIIYDRRKNKTISLVGFFHPGYVFPLNNDTVFVKAMESDYKLYRIATDEYQIILPRNHKLQSSEICPIITPDQKYFIDIDYLYSSPQKKIMVGELTEPYRVTYLDFNREGQIGALRYNKIKSEFVIAENVPEDVCLHTYSYPGFEKQETYHIKAKTMVQGVAWDEKGEYQIMYGEPGGIVLANENEVVRVFKYEGSMHWITISPSNKYFGAVFRGKTIIFDMISGEAVKEYDLEYNHSVNFCDDDTGLLLGTWEKGLYIPNFINE